MSLEHLDRESMHVVEHHDDLLPWKKYNNHMYVNSSELYRNKKGNGFALKKL
jgi:hypothetical protein